MHVIIAWSLVIGNPRLLDQLFALRSFLYRVIDKAGLILLPFALLFLLLVYVNISRRFRVIFLVSVSIFYYVWITDFDPFSIGLLAASIVMDYLLARRIPHAATPGRLLLISIVVNIGTLAIFKFPDVFLPLFNDPASTFSVGYQFKALVMPIGLSFYTFAKLGYVIDTYQKTIEPEQNLARFVTFAAFFPNIVSGPIEKARHFLPQLNQPAGFDEDRIVVGLRRILWGLFKKIVIANRLAVYVNYVYSDPHQFDGRMLILATLFFSFQIYADFSGYTDIVIGAAKLFGFDLLENFNRPYFAVSVLDFWNRWHISLTAWIRGYLFMPISRRLLKIRWTKAPWVAQALAYAIVMGLVGLWHGSQWTFVLWGLIHALYLVVLMMSPSRYRLPPKTFGNQLARIVVTFVLVSLAWIVFRATSLSDASYILTHLFDFDFNQDMLAPFKQALWLFDAETELVLSLLLVVLLLMADWSSLRQVSWNDIPAVVRWGTYYALLAGILMSQLMNNTGTQNFIYRQF